jgi:hypothetical protein
VSCPYIRGVYSVKTLQVIQTMSMRGFGNNDEPHRTVIQIWDMGGNLLAEHDPMIYPNGVAAGICPQILEGCRQRAHPFHDLLCTTNQEDIQSGG